MPSPTRRELKGVNDLLLRSHLLRRLAVETELAAKLLSPPTGGLIAASLVDCGEGMGAVNAPGATTAMPPAAACCSSIWPSFRQWRSS